MTGLGDPRYIRFTNFRKVGTTVSTPVWFAPMGDEWVFSSNPTAGKVKRLRNNPAVEIAASDWRGRVKNGSPVFGGTARLLQGGEADDAKRAMKAKYGIQWAFISISETLRILTRRPHGEVFIAVTLGDVARTE